MRTTGAFIVALAFALAAATPSQAAPVNKAAIADTIKADIAQMVAGINAHDPVRATMFDAPDIVSMESMREPSVGADADRQGIGMAFQYSPSWQVHLIDESVDVADAGDMAIYRSTYDENSTNDGVRMTHKVNYIAEFRKQADGSWKIAWSVVCAQSRSHPVTASTQH
ncbi:MAG: DUF4440 domain-containing protein [Alphaproteobacteria bacterium]